MRAVQVAGSCDMVLTSRGLRPPYRRGVCSQSLRPRSPLRSTFYKANGGAQRRFPGQAPAVVQLSVIRELLLGAETLNQLVQFVRLHWLCQMAIEACFMCTSLVFVRAPSS